MRHLFSAAESLITTHRTHRTLGWWMWRATLVSLLCLLLWDASGLDVWVMQHIASPAGFELTNNYWLSAVLHTGARNAAVVVIVCLWLLALVWPSNAHPQLGRRVQRVWLLLGVALSLMLISTLKALSGVSCPWELSQFGGTAAYVSHWRFGVADNGSGGCFPGGHVSSAFGYVALLPGFLMAAEAPIRSRARMALFALMVIGLALGLAQTLRGAHYPSHTLWTAWLCWVSAWAWYVLGEWLQVKRLRYPQKKTAHAQAGHNKTSRDKASPTHP
jgi:membrane-associated PAP2 superfamily phosphatase